MGLGSIKNKVTSKIGRQVLVAQKHSPVLLFGVGAVGVVATTVLACRATLKMEGVLREAEDRNAKIAQARELDPEKYTDEDAKKDGLTTRVQLCIKIARLYAPAVVVGAVTIGALTGSHVVLSRRNVALTTAYAGLQKGFNEYRGRVVEEFGEEKDTEFRFGVTEREIAVETDEGIMVRTIREVNVPADGKSIYARLFAEGESSNWQPTTSYNAMFIQSQQNYANDLLRARGHLFLNEVYDMLGLKRSKEGSVVGWVYNNERGGDNYIDFGVFTDVGRGQRFVEGFASAVLLDFNVDGVIYDLI